jgi:hypothetical protein
VSRQAREIALDFTTVLEASLAVILAQEAIVRHTIEANVHSAKGDGSNPRPLGYEPNELPDCSTPRHDLVVSLWSFVVSPS